MTREEAEEICTQRNRGSSAPDAGHWLAREVTPGDWHVVRVHVPGLTASRPVTATTEARPRPETPPDPRPAIFRDIPPYGAA